MSLLEHVLAATERGWAVFPLKPYDKTPAVDGWQTVSTTDEATVRRWFDGDRFTGYGIDCGKSGLLVVDQDLNPAPVTTVNGIDSAGVPVDGIREWEALLLGMGAVSVGNYEVTTVKGGKHSFFRSTGDYGNGKGSLPRGIDVRGRGGFVVGAGSVVRTEQKRWDGQRAMTVKFEGEYAATDGFIPVLPDWLAERLGAKRGRKSVVNRPKAAPYTPAVRRRAEALAEELGESEGGALSDNRAYATACMIGEYVGAHDGFEIDEALDILQGATAHWGYDKPEDEAAVLKAFENGLAKGQESPRAWVEGVSGAVAKLAAAVAVSAATTQAKRMPGPSQSYEVAKLISERFGRTDDILHAKSFNDELYVWNGHVWELWSENKVDTWLNHELVGCEYVDDRGATRPWGPNPAKVKAVRESMLTGGVPQHHEDEPARGVFCRNGMVDLETNMLEESWLGRFNTHALPFDYDPDADCPVWRQFLDASIPDRDGQAFLQEWFGYVLSGRTDLQVIASLVGKPGSGKSIIAEMLSALVGDDYTTSINLAMLATEDGKRTLMGKTLAVIPDANWVVAHKGTAIEALKSVSGEDRQSIKRLYRSHWMGKLGVRFMAIGNDTPSFNDPSGALMRRMIHVYFPNSFRGTVDEDPTLRPRIRKELAGILNWALVGLRRLEKLGRFTVPAASKDISREVDEQSSSIGGFIAECIDRTGDEADTIPVAAFCRMFSLWLEALGDDTKVSSKRVTGELKSMGHESVMKYPERKKHYVGLTVAPEAETLFKQALDPTANPRF